MPDIESLERLRAEMAGSATEPYLLSVTAGDEPHCGPVTVTWDAAGRQLLVSPPPSSWPGSVESGHEQVSLLWPPAEPGGYSLIVDGPARTVADADDPRLEITPSKAVLHRRGVATAANTTACRSDCVPIISRH